MARHKKNLSHYTSLNYRIEIERDDEGDFVATIPLLPGCIADGATVEQAAARIEEAKAEWIAARLESNLPVPEPQAEFSGRWVLRTTRTLHRRVAECARHEAVSINHFVNGVLSEAVGRRQLFATWSDPNCKILLGHTQSGMYVAFGNSLGGALLWQHGPASLTPTNPAVKPVEILEPLELRA